LQARAGLSIGARNGPGLGGNRASGIHNRTDGIGPGSRRLADFTPVLFLAAPQNSLILKRAAARF
jgi:hypothetical protein